MCFALIPFAGKLRHLPYLLPRANHLFLAARSLSSVCFGDLIVTIDKTLKRKGRLARSRNVLKRGERIDQMKFEENWIEGRSPLGLPKTRVAKAVIGKKKKKKTKEEEAEGAAAKEAPAKAAAKPAGKAPAKPAAKPPAKK